MNLFLIFYQGNFELLLQANPRDLVQNGGTLTEAEYLHLQALRIRLVSTLMIAFLIMALALVTRVAPWGRQWIKEQEPSETSR